MLADMSGDSVESVESDAGSRHLWNNTLVGTNVSSATREKPSRQVVKSTVFVGRVQAATRLDQTSTRSAEKSACREWKTARHRNVYDENSDGETRQQGGQMIDLVQARVLQSCLWVALASI